MSVKKKMCEKCNTVIEPTESLLHHIFLVHTLPDLDKMLFIADELMQGNVCAECCYPLPSDMREWALYTDNHIAFFHMHKECIRSIERSMKDN